MYINTYIYIIQITMSSLKCKSYQYIYTYKQNIYTQKNVGLDERLQFSLNSNDVAI